MKTLSHKQGTQEWKDWRQQHFTASDAASILGIEGAYRSRQSVLWEKQTGNHPETSAHQQMIFASGHEAENLAREIIEEQIGEELYPVVGIMDDGKIAASFDGITLDEQTIWEHKHYNGSKASTKRFDNAKKGVLDKKDMAQVQQQLLVSGAAKCLFTVSDGTANNMATVEVLPDHDWFQRIKDGWAQFEIDLETAQTVNIDNADWAAAADDLRTIREQLKVLQAEEKATVARIRKIAERSGGQRVIGGGMTAQYCERRGNIDYKAIPELDGVDLEQYRKPASSYWRVEVGETA